MMLTIEANFKANTFAGHTECQAHKYVFGNGRDIESAEDAIKWIQDVLRKGDDPMITFGCFNDTQHNFHRVFPDYKDGKKGFRYIQWTNKGNVLSDDFVEKLTKKDVRAMYLRCADRALDFEEQTQTA